MASSMAHEPLALSAFLNEAKSNLATSIKSRSRVTFVVGNQSADLDSFTSSLLYAYFRTQAPPADAHARLYTPLLNIPREDIPLRPEFRALYRLVFAGSREGGEGGLTDGLLCSLSDLPRLEKLEAELPPENTQWILVDHNKLEGTLGEIYGGRVQGVLDHHEEEHAVPYNTGCEPRVVEKCGSCTSLVVQHVCRPIWEAAFGGGEEEKSGEGVRSSVNGQIAAEQEVALAKIGLASILIDTRNLTDESKVRDVDRQAADFLKGRILQKGVRGQWDQEEFFAGLDRAKKDIEGLELKAILRKDYKEWQEAGMKLGMSSAVKSLKFLGEKARAEEKSWDQIATEFMSERKLTIWAVMTAFVPSEEEGKEFRRELYVQWKGGPESAAAKAVILFQQDAEKELGLQGIEVQGVATPQCRIWRQMSTDKSRKQVGPLLRKAMVNSSRSSL